MQATPQSAESAYRPEIDGLRAFAVTLVIINHFNEDILPGGYLGVDIFFVISGYVITSSLTRKSNSSFRDFLSGFYERRVKRLAPALLTFTLIGSIAICLFNPQPEPSLRTGISSLFGASNLYLLKLSTDYFAQSTQLNIFTHTWSLGVEEQFYILFPFLIWFSGFGRQAKNSSRNLFLVVGTLAIASLIVFLYLYSTNEPAAYFLMPSRFWEMASGCLIFIGFQKRVSIEQFLEKAPPLLVLALIVFVMYLPKSMATISTIAVVVLSSILIACLKQQTGAFRALTNPKVIYIGLISYSLYLWHWGVLSISRWTIGIHWWTVPFQIALMLGLAIASYRWIETPLRKSNWFGRRWKTLAVGGGALFIATGSLFTLERIKTRLYSGQEPATTEWSTLVINSLPVQDRTCTPREVADGLKKQCTRITAKATRNVHLFGDSHMQHHLPMIERLSKEYNWNYYFYGRKGFPVGKRYNQGRLMDDTDTKYAINEAVKKLSHGDLFIVSERNEQNFSEYMLDLEYGIGSNYIAFINEDGEAISKEQALLRYKQYLSSLAQRVNNRGATLILFQPTPSFPGIASGDDGVCLQWFGRLNNICTEGMGAINMKEWLDHVSNTITMHNDLSIERPGSVLVFNPLEVLCPESSKKCSRYANGEKLYTDDDHLSEKGSIKLISQFKALLEEIRN